MQGAGITRTVLQRLTGSVRCACASAHRSRQNSSRAEEPSRLRSEAACGRGEGRAGGAASVFGACNQQPMHSVLLLSAPQLCQPPCPARLTTTLRRCPSPSASPLSRRSDSVRRASVSSSLRLRQGKQCSRGQSK